MFVDLVTQAQCRTVRSWSIAQDSSRPGRDRAVVHARRAPRLARDGGSRRREPRRRPVRGDPSLKNVPCERWLRLLDTAAPAALDVLCEMLKELIAVERVTLIDAVNLARARPLPVARLGLQWLQTKTPRNEAECRAVRTLVEADCETLRPEIVVWAVEVLSASPLFRPEWVLDWLDSRHEDVRAVGWTWFQNDERRWVMM